MSAIADSTDGPTPPIQVLFALHPGFDMLGLSAALEVFSGARHDIKEADTVAFKISFAAEDEHTVSAQGASIRSDMDFEDAHDEIRDFDMLVIPGGSEEATLEKKGEPLELIKAFAELQKKDPTKERTLVGLSGGAMFLAEAGVLQGMGATTHPDLYTRFEILCQQAARRGELEQTDVMEERYVVNNARFSLGEDEDENPFIFRKRPDASAKSTARKGSNAWRESNRRRESAAARAVMKLGGLRVLTSGGGTAALDASLYLVSAMVSHESAEELARLLQYQWNKGVVVNSIDV